MGVLAGLISLFVPGTGQVYHRKYIEGAIIFFLWSLWIILTKYFYKIELIYVFIGWIAFSAFSALDATLFESKKTREEDIQIKEFDEMQEFEEKKEKFEKIDEKAREALND